MEPLATTEQARAVLDASLSDFCEDFNRESVTPILEADIAGYLYHRIVENGCPPNMVYLATRVCGEAARIRKPDIVIGTLNKSDACITPLLICELKVFQRWGHSDQQMRHRFSGLLAEDLPSLGEATNVLPIGRLEIVADLFVSRQRRGYLTGMWDGQNRKDLVADKCKKIGAALIWIHPQLEVDDIVCEIVV
jgi:hypothetical protein